MQIQNIHRKNRTVSIGGAAVVFDADGRADAPDDVAAKLLKLGGYSTARQSRQDVKADSAEPGGAALDGLSVAQLKKLAKERGIDVGDASKKAELIQVIEAAAV